MNNILFLYRINPGKKIPPSVSMKIKEYIKSDRRRILIYNCYFPTPAFLLKYPFDAILLDVTLCGCRWLKGKLFRRVEKIFEALSEVSAVKIAFPQDDYTLPSVLDRWFVLGKIDVVYSVLDRHLDSLYPEYSKVGCIRRGYTGYVFEETLSYKTLPLIERPLDIGYRARKLPAEFGRLGQQKWQLAEKFREEAERRGFLCDISTDPNKGIWGTAWFDFISNCKFTFGTNSGSSVIDHDGSITSKVQNVLKANPNASFEEIEFRAFPGEDGKYILTALSPRNIEAGLLKSCQILVRGDYSGVLKAGEDYIPLEPDFSNIDEVFDTMSDLRKCQAIADHCYTTIMSRTDLRIENHIAEVENVIKDLNGGRVTILKQPSWIDVVSLIVSFFILKPIIYFSYLTKSVIGMTVRRFYPRH